MTVLFNIGLAACAAALVAAIVGLISKRRFFDGLSTALIGAAAGVQTAYIVARWVAAGRPPFSNMFESLVLFAWAVIVIYLLLRLWIDIPLLAAPAALLSALALAYASTFGFEIQPLVPALQSNWLTFHVFTCFLGYGGFAVSFLASIGYLIADRPGGRATPEARETLESVMARTVSFGFVFLTLGIITGAVWANSAWGSYWSWDPKEVWSLITWLIYAVFLHCRFMRGWRGRRAAWISIVGFAAVLFTYVGVNLFLSGLHSYGSN
jgi:cytochrome c-type biogenesis protein CcsB